MSSGDSQAHKTNRRSARVQTQEENHEPVDTVNPKPPAR